MTKPMHVVEAAIAIFPRALKMFPIPSTRVNLAACLTISEIAFQAEVQKFSDDRAI